MQHKNKNNNKTASGGAKKVALTLAECQKKFAYFISMTDDKFRRVLACICICQLLLLLLHFLSKSFAGGKRFY